MSTMNTIRRGLLPRHIQNFSEATAVTHHWGYADRMVPCTNDAGSCAYLDVVYHSHDLGMLYVGIIWASLLGLLFLWAIYNWSVPKRSAITGFFSRTRCTLGAYRRQYLLPEFARPIFGRTTSTQVLVLAMLVGYLTIFSFVGIVYNTWITPVKKMPGVYNTRTSLGPWADRVGVIAYALTPLSILLSSRESLLSLITGLPYQSFNFLHRWLGYVIVAQSVLHTIGWSIIEIRLYQPQPKVANDWIKQLYMIWGVVAMIFLFILFVLSTPWAIKRTGYEFFRKSHYVLAMLYIGACIGHWKQLQCFLVPSLVIWFLDRSIRLIRTGLLHYNYIGGTNDVGFHATQANLTAFSDEVNGDIVRLDFLQQQDQWAIGQHFYLTFPKLSLWQSHPFTPLSIPTQTPHGVTHSYIFRAKKGETARVMQLATSLSSVTNSKMLSVPKTATSVIVNGPYGVSEVDHLTPSTNILCVAGGTGITYVLPVLLSQVTDCQCSSDRKMQLIWAVRRKADIAWIKPELDRLFEASKSVDLKIRIFVTREDAKGSESSCTSSLHKGTDITVAEKISSSSSTSSDADDETVAPIVGGCCKPKASNDLETALCAPSAPRRQSLTIERRGSISTTPAEMRHPELQSLVKDFVAGTTQSSTTVYASGPGGMITDLRQIVAACNDGAMVWRGDERANVELKCDDRLEW